METKTMKKTQITLSFVLASFLVVGLAASLNAKKVSASYADDGFTMVTDLSTEKVIHTEQQATYLAYDGEYVSIPEADYPNGDKHLSDPEPVRLQWTFTPPAGKTISTFDVAVGREQDLSDAYVIKGTSSASLDVYNSYLGDNYFRVIVNYMDGTNDRSEIQKYVVENVYPRNLKIDGMTNCRDMGGGRELEDGGYIKQGLIYRTSGTNSWGNGRAVVPDTITAAGKEELLIRLGCKTEINVNNSGSNQVGVENFVDAYMYYDGGKHHMYRNSEPLKRVFHALADPSNYPVFYHCRIGTDRTGFVAIMLSALLGVSENEIYQDYLFSNFGNIQEKRYIGDKAGRDNILKYMDDLKTYPGEKLQNKAYNFLLAIGIPAEELDSIINILTVGTKAQGNNNHQEVILAEDFVADGTEMKSIPDTATGNASRAHPKNYYTLGADQSVSASFNPDYSGRAALYAYLGSTDSSSSKKIVDSVYATLDDNDVEIDEDLTFADAGFGQGEGRTYYAPVLLGEVDIIRGATEVVVGGIANDLNIGALAIIPLETIADEDPVTPEPDISPAPKKGCGGSIIATSAILGMVALIGGAIIVIKRKEN